MTAIKTQNDYMFSYDKSPFAPYTEERSRWSVLQYADVLGYIPIVACAIGIIRSVGGFFVLSGANLARLIYKGNAETEKKFRFIAQRAEDEIGRGALEIGTFGFTTYLMDYEAKFETRRAAITIARSNMFRVNSNGAIHYPRYYLDEKGQPIHPISSKQADQTPPDFGVLSQDLYDFQDSL